MNIRIFSSAPCGQIAAPPSKSDVHRLLLCAGLAKGKSVIENVQLSDDIKATLNCLEAMGVKWQKAGNTVIVEGTDVCSISEKKELFCNECGTTIRFFIPLCLLSNNEFTIFGSERLLKRPLTVYEDICKEQNICFENDGEKIKLKGKLSPGEYKIKGNISSQFISGLLFALPLLNGDSVIKIIPPFESKPYVKMTLSALSRSGIEINQKDEFAFEIKGNQTYKPINCKAEGDWSNAAFLYALKAMGNDLQINGLNDDSLQGDKICVSHFEKLKNGYAEIDLSDSPDLAPILFAFAGMNKGAKFTGVSRLRIKESNRISKTAEELSKFGIKLDEYDDYVIVEGGTLHPPKESLNGQNDHRIVMTEAVLLTKFGGVIEGAEAVKKSYPDFFDDLQKIGVNALFN